MSKPVTPEESALIREAYKAGGAPAAKALRDELTARVETPRCPTCHSDRIQRISPSGKVVKIAGLGVFGLGDVHKIFKCLNCGYKW